MFHKSWIPVWLVLILVFIGFGDKFLPQPLSGASYKTRTTINNVMMSSFKLWTPKTNPHNRTERALEEQEAGKKP
jgi:hypothetical protein